MKTVSFTFNLFDKLFPKAEHDSDFGYFKWPVNWEKKNWAKGLKASDVFLLLKIGQLYGNNVTTDGQLNDIPMTTLGQDSNNRLTRGMVKLEQNGIISNLTFDSKLVSKKVSIDNVTPLVYDPPKRKQAKTNPGVDEVLDFLRLKTGINFKRSDEVKARLAEGYTVDQLKWVVRHKCSEWKDTDMGKYLRPSTIFGKSKFQEYLPQAEAYVKKHDEMEEIMSNGTR